MELLLLMSTLLCAVTVYGACVVNEGPAPCPPPFPDFAAIFRETLNLVPELKLSIQNATSAAGSGCSPMTVNWTQFNSLLDDGNPVPLGPICQQSTTTAPSYSGSTTASPEVIPGAVQPMESRNRIIAIAVGVGGGVVVISAAVILIIFAATKCRRQKVDVLQRTVSTISQAALVTDESYQPTTPDTPFQQDDAFGVLDNSRSSRKGVIELSDCTFHDSSTDATLPRTKDPTTHVTLERRVTTEKEIESLEEAKTTTIGCVNLASVTTEDEEQDDAGYAGSEIGQELWESEINAMFEGAKMEEKEKEEDADESARLPPIENRRQEEKSDPGSVRCDETAPRMRDLTISTKPQLNLNTSSSESYAYQSDEITPTKLPGSPFSTPSSTKPLISPRQFGSRHPLSQAPASDENSTKVPKAKVRFESDSNETPPPAYSSPPPLSLTGPVGLYYSDRHAEMPIDVPNELPSYTEAVSALAGNHEPSGWQPVAAKRKPPRPQTKPKSTSSVDSQKSPVTTSPPPGKRTDAPAVVARPRVPLPTAKKIVVDGESARQDRVNPNSEGDDSTSTGQSSRPVRSLLSQFEAISNRRPD